jgi:hypothetical protein
LQRSRLSLKGSNGGPERAMNAEREHKHLAQADRYIAELKKDIARQIPC